MENRNHKSFYIFIILIALFVIPLLLAWLLVTHHEGIGTGITNYGKLINPPLHLTSLHLPDKTKLKGKWLLVFVNPSTTCGKLCQQNLYHMQQIHQASGKDIPRIKLVLINLSTQQKYPHILEILTSKTQMQNFLEQSPDKTLILEQGSLYLVDPRDNVIMQYAANANPRGVFKDLEKLLRISQIG